MQTNENCHLSTCTGHHHLQLLEQLLQSEPVHDHADHSRKGRADWDDPLRPPIRVWSALVSFFFFVFNALDFARALCQCVQFYSILVCSTRSPSWSLPATTSWIAQCARRCLSRQVNYSASENSTASTRHKQHTHTLFTSCVSHKSASRNL